MTQEGLTARGLRVKTMEWDDLAHDSFTAATSLGDYIVELHGSWGMWTPDEGEFSSDAHSWHASESAAKSAAQADYAARILAALEDAGEPALIREAEARGMERAATWHDAEIAGLEKQIEENNEYLRRRHGEGGAYARASEANDHCRTNITAHRISAAAIRAAAAAIRGEGK